MEKEYLPIFEPTPEYSYSGLPGMGKEYLPIFGPTADYSSSGLARRGGEGLFTNIYSTDMLQLALLNVVISNYRNFLHFLRQQIVIPECEGDACNYSKGKI